MTQLSAPRRKTPLTRFFLPLISIGILVYLWRYNLKWGTIPVVVFVIFYYWLLPKVSRSMTLRFNRKAILLLTRGKAAEVPNLVRRNFLFQLIAPKGVLDAKLALAYLECEQFPLALRCFEASVPYADGAERPALLHGLVKALFATGDFAKAEIEAKEVMRNITKLPELLAIAARCRVGLGKVDDETRRLLDEADALSPSEDVRLMTVLTRIEGALLEGRTPPQLPEGADSSRKLLRGWIHLVRGLLRERRGDTEKAAHSFTQAREILPNTFVFAEATRRLTVVAQKAAPNAPGADNGLKDDALRRKKRKRR